MVFWLLNVNSGTPFSLQTDRRNYEPVCHHMEEKPYKKKNDTHITHLQSHRTERVFVSCHVAIFHLQVALTNIVLATTLLQEMHLSQNKMMYMYRGNINTSIARHLTVSLC